ncbi:MCE family protein [Nocardia arthritidis]|uniref:MCE family protein n=1 Tax=Nocardia arthritidis TaxID=228602 RepID=A0A6G9Y5Z0_9NOCA|nr:MCE family protein [Nocardia arthritidis]QIS08507.1 MCE family protein [Nocardia arthritidis]
MRTFATVALGLAVALGISGCEWDGLNSLPMPGVQGTGADAYRVRIQMPNVTTLTRNSPVRVNDVTVGTVSKIEVEGWHALVTVSLDHDVHLPANATAKIGQTSLLGSNHLELAPPTDTAPVGELRDGDLIPLDRAGDYPTTEQVLSSLSVVLNGGGISQLETITRELNSALSGHETQIRDLIPRLNELTTTLDKQTGDIINAMSGLDRLTGQIAQQRDVVAKAIEQIHPALTVLADRRENITRALTALGALSDVTQRIIDTSGGDLKANLKSLAPVLQTLADTNNNLIEALKIALTFPFPMKNLDHAIKGDYLNLFMTVDMTGKRLDSNWLTGSPLGGRFGGVEGALGAFAPSTAAQGGNPATGPLQPPGTPAPPTPTIPGLPPIPGLPAIPGLTVPLPESGAQQGGPGR